MSSSSRILVLPALLAASLSQACGDAPLPNAPNATEAPPQNFVLTGDVRAAFGIALEDARLRILPILAEQSAAAGIGQALDALSAALTTTDRTALAQAVARTESLLDVTSGTDALASAAADLEALRLILMATRPLLDARTNSMPIRSTDVR